jgi:hypothetical protein
MQIFFMLGLHLGIHLGIQKQCKKKQIKYT